MSVPSWPEGSGRRILTLAGNDLTIDARARKTAASLASDGHRVVAIGLDASGMLPRAGNIGGALLHRVAPDLDPRLTPRITRWGYSGLVNQLRESTEIQRQRLQLSRRNLSASDRLALGEIRPSAAFAATWAGRVLRRLPVKADQRTRLVRAIRSRVGAGAQRIRRYPRRVHTIEVTWYRR